MPEMFTEDGIMVNGLYGYCKFIIDLINKHNKEDFSIVATFDRCSQNFRKEISEDYKMNRKKTDSSLIVQLQLAAEFCESIGIKTLHHVRYEADDIIASIAKKEENNHEIYVVSPDKDLMQLITDKTKVLNPFTKQTLDTDYVYKKFGIYPKDFHLFLALCGDSSDNIKGIEGIGPKTASKIMSQTLNIAEMPALFPKYDFSKLELMLKLTSLYIGYEFQPIEAFDVNYHNCHSALNRFGFKSIKLNNIAKQRAEAHK
jgi:DNA polymerase-1